MSPSIRHLTKPCDHRCAAFGYDHHDDVRGVDVEYIRCMCGERLSLGESNDADERVRIEISAVEVVATYKPELVKALAAVPCFLSLSFEQCEACQTYALAHAIATHSDGGDDRYARAVRGASDWAREDVAGGGEGGVRIPIDEQDLSKMSAAEARQHILDVERLVDLAFRNKDKIRALGARIARLESLLKCACDNLETEGLSEVADDIRTAAMEAKP